MRVLAFRKRLIVLAEERSVKLGKDLQGKQLPTGIMQRPNGTYRARFKYKGEKYTLDNANLKELIEQMEELKYEVKHGIRGKGDNLTLDSWFDVWLNTHKKKSIKESTLSRYDYCYKNYVQERLGKRKLADFKPILLERLFQEMADDNYSTKTIRDIYNILSAMFKYAVHNRIISFNPCDGVELPKTKKKPIRVLSVEEQGEVLRYAQDRLYENLIVTALGTGMRAGELLGLSEDDLNFKKREITINKTLVYIKDLSTGKYVFKFQTPKTESGKRVIPMQESVYKALRKQRTQKKEMQIASDAWEPLRGFENLVFVSRNGKPVSEHAFQSALDWIVNAINKDRQKQAEKGKKDFVPMEHIYPHVLRHTFATRCFEAGIEAKTVQKYLGHSSVAITLDIYTHVTDDKAKEDMNKLEELYEKII